MAGRACRVYPRRQEIYKRSPEQPDLLQELPGKFGTGAAFVAGFKAVATATAPSSFIACSSGMAGK